MILCEKEERMYPQIESAVFAGFPLLALSTDQELLEKEVMLNNSANSTM